MDNNESNKDGQRPNPRAQSGINNSDLLVALNEAMFRRLAPSVAVLVALMVVGALGNILVCYMFIRKLRRSSQNFLLLSLGVFDLLSSCVGVPSEIFDIRHYYLYESVEVCKAMRFLTTFPSLASILVLLVIALDRYWKICRPLHSQIDLNHVRVTVIIIVIIALIFSVPALYIYGHRTFPTPLAGVSGYDCSVDDVFKDRPYPLVYEGILLVAFFVFALVLVCIYVRIWLETRRHIKYLNTHATFGTNLLEEATTTTSSVNYEDTAMEKVGDDSRSKPRKASKKSLRKKLVPSRIRRQIKSNSTCEAERSMLHEVHPSVSFIIAGLSVDTSDNEAKPVSGKCTHQRLDGVTSKDNYEASVASSDIPKRGVLEDATEAARTLLKSLPLDVSDASEHMDLEDSTETSRTLLGPFLVGNPGTEDLTESSRTMIGSISCGSVDVYSSYAVPADKGVPQDVSEEISVLSEDGSCNNSRATAGQKRLDSNGSQLSKGQLEENDDEDRVASRSDRSGRCPGDNEDRLASRSDLSGRGPGRWSIRLTHQLIKNSPKINIPITEDLPRTNTILNNSEDLRHIPTCATRQPRRSDNSYQLVPDKEITAPCMNQNGAENSSCLPSICENIMRGESKHDRERNDKTCSMSPRKSESDSRCSKHSMSKSLKLEPKENTSLVSDNTQKHNNTQSKRISFFNQSEIKLEPPDGKIDQSMRYSLTSQSRGSTKSSQSANTAKRARKALRATRTTIIAFAITSGFILSYLPHLLLIILRIVRTDFEHNLDDASLIFYNIFLRSYFVNNVVNVFVYGTINLHFRTEILVLWRNIKCWRS